MRRTELRLSRQMKMFDCDPVGIHEYVDNFFKELNKTIS